MQGFHLCSWYLSKLERLVVNPLHAVLHIVTYCSICLTLLIHLVRLIDLYSRWKHDPLMRFIHHGWLVLVSISVQAKALRN